MSDKPRPMPTGVAATNRSPYHGYRFPPEIIAHAVWLYFRFHLSFRDVEDLLAERGISVSHEAIRQWCTKFGAAFASGLRRRRARPGDKWHIDEVLLKISGKRHWLWRAVDQYGVVLDILVQSRRDQQAAERFLRQVVDGVGYEPRVSGSNPPSTRSVSWDRSAPSATTSVRVDISSPLPLIDNSAPSVTPSGGISPWAECAHDTFPNELTHASSCSVPLSNSST